MRATGAIDRDAANTLARHGLGFARMAADGTLLARAGAALDWLPGIGGDCLATPLLFGMADELAALRAGARDIVALPSIGLDSGEKIGVTISWDEAQDVFSIAAARAFGASETETMLVRERRERRLADEQAEAARRRANVSDALYRDIVESSADLVLRIAADGTISFANIHAQGFCGRSLAALVGVRLEETLRPLGGADWGALAQRAGEETFEQKLAAADGRAAWILWRVTWLGEAEGPPEFQAVGRDITQLRELQAEVERAQAAARQALLMRERLTIAHDLHDTIVHALVAVVAQLRLVRKLAERAPARVPDELARAEEAASAGLARGREALGQVRFQRAGDEGLAAALRRAARRFEERTGLPAQIVVDEYVANVHGEQAERLYRIAEEALRNVERHAEASRVSVAAAVADGEVRIEIVDDGRGFDPDAANPGHYGLAGMAEQAHMIGGNLAVQTSPGQGARIAIRAPLVQQER
ncbi:MAG TPA: histidine kinase [Rhodoblastus sp.]|nr:histidine kinase [Rhodoblastus sp.]